jgi:hypothetical protein
MACSYYTADYPCQSEIKEIEKLRFLHSSYISSLNQIELEVYTQQNENLYIHGTTAIEGNTLTLQDMKKSWPTLEILLFLQQDKPNSIRFDKMAVSRFFCKITNINNLLGRNLQTLRKKVMCFLFFFVFTATK